MMYSPRAEGTGRRFLAAIVDDLSMMSSYLLVVDSEVGWRGCGSGVVATQQGKEVGMIAEIEDKVRRCLEAGHLNNRL